MFDRDREFQISGIWIGIILAFAVIGAMAFLGAFIAYFQEAFHVS